MAADERLTVLHDPDHPLVLAPSPTLTLEPVSVSSFALAQQWQIPRLLRDLATTGSRSAGSAPSRATERPRSTVLYHSGYNLMPYAPGAPTILTAYDLIPLLMPQQSSGRARLLARWANILALRTAHLVLAISEATRRDYLAHFRVPPDRIITTPLAADATFRPISPQGIAALRARCALPERYVLYLGSNKPHKNLVRLVEAWHMVVRGPRATDGAMDSHSRGRPSATRLVIAGAWDERYPHARQRATQLGLEEEVLFLGAVAGADLPALYAGAEIFLFPSLYEGFGLPVLEAMACGAPVICSDASSLPEVAGTAALLVDPLDAGAMAAAISRVLADATLREQMRAAGLAQAGRFTWARTAQQTLAAYRQVSNKIS
jgi:alpha-1,3-rhamnosyl/mannosyltransferase